MRPSFAVLIGMALLAVPSASAEDSPVAPGLGEIMTLQQLRHIKLWFAGRAGNWPLADYEMGELNEGFENVNKLLGGDTVDKAVGAPMQALQKIIDNKDRAAFTSAFDQLTAGCNSCHRTLDHGSSPSSGRRRCPIAIKISRRRSSASVSSAPCKCARRRARRRSDRAFRERPAYAPPWRGRRAPRGWSTPR